MRARRLVLATLLAAGCSSPVAPDPAAFGALYMIQTEPNPPVLDGPTLTLTLEFGGCGGLHEFELRHRMTSATGVDMWLRKITPDQPCDMLMIQRRDFPVPNAVIAATTVRLLGPGGAEFQLQP